MFCADLNAKYAKFYAKERKVVMLILLQIHRFLVIFREFLNRASPSFFELDGVERAAQRPKLRTFYLLRV